MSYHPETSVNFAATDAFVRKWPEEADHQQIAFERPSWAKTAVAPPAAMIPPSMSLNEQLIWGALFLAVVGIGTYALWRARE